MLSSRFMAAPKDRFMNARLLSYQAALSAKMVTGSARDHDDAAVAGLESAFLEEGSRAVPARSWPTSWRCRDARRGGSLIVLRQSQGGEE